MSNSIRNGIEQIINCWLGLKPPASYQHPAVCNALSNKFPKGLNSSELMMRLYAQVERNWQDRGYNKEIPPSVENWEIRKRPNIGANSKSKEKKLERALIKVTGEEWFNEVPVASVMFQ